MERNGAPAETSAYPNVSRRIHWWCSCFWFNLYRRVGFIPRLQYLSSYEHVCCPNRTCNRIVWGMAGLENQIGYYYTLTPMETTKLDWSCSKIKMNLPVTSCANR